MCRGKADGGRRCSGCDAPEARAAHNARRRRNRELKKEIIAQAEQQGIEQAVVDELKGKPPAAAKEWARAHGLPSRFHPGHGHEGDPPRQRRLRPGPPGVPGVFHTYGEAAGAPDRPQQPDAPAVVAEARAPWLTPGLAEQIVHATRTQGEHRDERNLMGGRPQRLEPVADGTNETTRVFLDNGVTGYHKPFADLDEDTAVGFGHDSSQQCIHEVAAWRVASSMGPPWDEIVAPCVLREVNGELGSFSMQRPGTPRANPTECPEWRSAAFYDALIGQQDRHRGNYLQAGDRLALIDHGYSFGRHGDYLNWSDFVVERSQATDADEQLLTGREVDVLDRFLGDESRFGLRGLIEADRLASMEARAKEMRRSGRILSVRGPATHQEGAGWARFVMTKSRALGER